MPKSHEQRLEDLKARTDEMIEAGQAANDEWSAIWEDGFNYIFGNQLARKKRKKGWPAVQMNYLWPAVAEQLAVQCQRRPRVVARPQEETDVRTAEFWRRLLQWQAKHDLRVPSLNLSAVLDAKIYGHYVAKVYWEPRARWDAREKTWRGAPRATLLYPEFFGADDAETLEDADFVYSRRRVRVDKLIGRWPKFKSEILKAAEEETEQELPEVARMRAQIESLSDQRDAGLKEGSIEGRLAWLLRRHHRYWPLLPGEKEDGEKAPVPRYVTLTDLYFRDDAESSGQETERIPVEELGDAIRNVGAVFRVRDPERFPGKGVGDLIFPGDWPTRVVRTWEGPVYPRGRRILRIGDTILNPREEDQVWAYDHWPFVVGTNFPLPHTWRGLNIVELARFLQDWLNAMGSNFGNWISFFGMPVTMVEEGAVAGDPENKNLAERLLAKAGAIWRLTAGGINRIKRDSPASLPMTGPKLYELFARELQDATGSHEVARGRQTKSDATATEIRTLAMTSQIRNGIQMYQMDQFDLRLLEAVAELDQDRLAEGDMVRIAGEQAATGSVLRTISQQELSAKFDLELEIASGVPWDLERRKADWVQLFSLVGPAVLPELLDAFEAPNRDEILQRHAAWQSIQQALAAS